MEYNKIVTLTFKREELLYDIKNIGWIKGDVMSEEMQHIKHLIQDIGEDGNVDRVTRIMDLAFAVCVELCYPFSKEDVDDETVKDDTLENADEYVLNLRVPDSFSKTTVQLLLRYIHEFIIYRALSDWFSIVYPEGKGIWDEKLANAESEISGLLNSRTKRVRRKQSLF
ncbi:MAG: hypothetical protein IJ197_08780 [Bacteroidaceae bacterium]|nr:hypothetical protein [Bacteroidaceae bacterium]